ncbi:hypothetical protein O181_091276 [Austropuccinia psidii MF-1]|uniref:Integrase catalytic domain-containing protein n=1 Tax=Austropuccinia psidii MF-1 TaxID=1389203 RepID=A0A9Q3IX41_9BASI|nr:hypothetical protein [Austropuccinia psidii MF-1]
MPRSPINVKDSSLDEEVIKTRMVKLTCTNWVQWSRQFENYLISKGMDDLLEPPSNDVKQTNKFEKKNSGALTLLWSSVSTEFEGILLNNKSSFHDCWISQAGCKKKGVQDKKKGKTNNQNTNHENKTNKRIERIEQLLEILQAANNISSVNEMYESKEPTRPTTSDSEAFILDEVNAMIPRQNHGLIYLDSGAGRTVVNDLPLLVDTTPVNKQINTISTPIKVAHQGTLNFKVIKLYLVYYVLNGPFNLLSVLQLCNHGLRFTMKSNIFIVKYENRIIDVFRRKGNLFVSKLPSILVYGMTNSESTWHLIHGHPSGSYIKALFAEELPCADAPFFKIHMETLQINPPTHKGHKYVLVLVDDFSRFNCIYLLSEKAQAKEQIKAYLMEIRNKLDIIPTYLHTNQGREFTSQSFLNYLTSQRVSLERGLPEPPQTNGIAEQFNQTLPSKIRCFLGQSNIPVAYWDKAASHALLLLNMLPHKHLNMKSPTTVLKKKHSLIELEIEFSRLVPFGIRVTTKILNPTSNIEP